MNIKSILEYLKSNGYSTTYCVLQLEHDQKSAGSTPSPSREGNSEGTAVASYNNQKYPNSYRQPMPPSVKLNNNRVKGESPINNTINGARNSTGLKTIREAPKTQAINGSSKPEVSLQSGRRVQDIRAKFEDNGRNTQSEPLKLEIDPADSNPSVNICPICTNEVKATCFSHFLKCSEKCAVCKDCYSRHLTTRIQGRQSLNIACPLCSKPVGYKDVKKAHGQKLVEGNIFKIYENALNEEQFFIRSNIFGAKDWIWCPTPGCGKKHAINPAQCKVECQNCRKAICTKHEMEWHKGLTCQQYQNELEKQKQQQIQKQQHKQRRIQEQETCRWIAVPTKPCPRCNINIEKNGDCMNMTCRCGNQFVWC